MIERVKQVLERVKGTPGLAARLSPDDNIIEDVGLDSLEMMEFMLEVEQQFELELDLEQMEFDVFESIAVFARFLERLQAQQRPGGPA